MSTNHTVDEINVIARTKAWLVHAVIGLNLCPFAKAVHIKNQIRYAVSNAMTPEDLRIALIAELEFLRDADPNTLDTTLLIHPQALIDFSDYNDFLDIADATIEDLELAGTIQIASFHPDYQFAGTEFDDIENCTNRSPYPILHLLRETSIDFAVTSFPEASEIFTKNILTLHRLGHTGWHRLTDQIAAAEPVSDIVAEKK